MTSQGILGQQCAWCQLPAVTKVEVEPEQRGKVRGRPTYKPPIIVPACGGDHSAVPEEGRHLSAHERLHRKAKGVKQLDIFGNEAA